MDLFLPLFSATCLLCLGKITHKIMYLSPSLFLQYLCLGLVSSVLYFPKMNAKNCWFSISLSIFLLLFPH